MGSVVNATIQQYSVRDHTQVTYLRIMTHTMTHIIMFDHLWASLLEFKKLFGNVPVWSSTRTSPPSSRVPSYAMYTMPLLCGYDYGVKLSQELN